MNGPQDRDDLLKAKSPYQYGATFCNTAFLQILSNKMLVKVIYLWKADEAFLSAPQPDCLITTAFVLSICSVQHAIYS